jgi:hypothetical protein
MQLAAHIQPPAADAISSIREQLDATTQALAAAEEAHSRQALASVQWERRGVLQRLVRRPVA